MQRSGGLMRRAAPAVGLLAVVVAVILGGDFFGLRTQLLGQEVPEPAAPAFSEQAGAAPTPEASATATRVRSQPWWQQVETLEGDGAATAEVTIDDRALQWRVKWQCESGSLTVEAAGRDAPVVHADCPDQGTGYLTGTGAASLEVTAGGSWQLDVGQQLDVPLVKPPTQAMQAPEAERVASGSFYDIDQTGRGEVVIYELGDGSYALRLADFFVTPNVDLEIRLSPQPQPRTTQEFDKPASAYVDTLRATTGSMNFDIPEDIDPTQYASVVIWCPPVQNAYAAASLEWSQ